MFGLHSGDGHQLWSMSYPPTVRMAPIQISSAQLPQMLSREWQAQHSCCQRLRSGLCDPCPARISQDSAAMRSCWRMQVRLKHAAVWRTSHDTATPPEVLLLGATQEGGTFYSVVDVHHGNETSSGTLPYNVTQVGDLCCHADGWTAIGWAYFLDYLGSIRQLGSLALTWLLLIAMRAGSVSYAGPEVTIVQDIERCCIDSHCSPRQMTPVRSL